MGYCTRHTLTIVKGDHSLIESLIGECEEASYAIDEDGSCYDECKWYRHPEDMMRFSSKHPEALFKLEGEGEEAGDLWVEYYQNGKCQVCKAKITFDEFDESKLV